MKPELFDEIASHDTNAHFQELGYLPLYTTSPEARIVIIGQAPGIKAQTSRRVWQDASGERLINWLGVSAEQFRDSHLVAHVPMDFYYPGKGKSGDLPPRPDFAPRWHQRILATMPHVELIILVGSYAQKYYLDYEKPYRLTQVVHNYQQYLPRYFPIVHPSPLNFRWHMRNPWFETDLVPELRSATRHLL